MIELLYPIEGDVPDYPLPKAEDALSRSSKSSDEEYFPIVEQSGEVVARAPRSYCHGGSMLLHPVVHLHVLRRDGALYLQQRAANKDLLPLKWDTAVGGHVRYGESVVEALFRESSEELDFTEYNPISICSYVFESRRERELVNVFAAVGRDFLLRPNPDELLGGRYWSREEIEAAIGSGLLTPNFEREYLNISKQLYSLL